MLPSDNHTIAAAAAALSSHPASFSRWTTLAWLDLLLIPPLLLFSFLFSLPSLLSLFIRVPKRGTRYMPAPSAYVVPAFTRHARFLPRPSAHRFSYNTLYLALRLDQLERHNLDTGHAFAWKGSHYDPDWQDESPLARSQLLRSGSMSLTASAAGSDRDVTEKTVDNDNRDDSSGSDAQQIAKPGLEDWKAGMRHLERKERRSKQERRRRVDATAWALTGLHPQSYLRNNFVLKPREDDATAAASTNGSDLEKKDKWLKGSILLKLAYELRERGYLKHGPQDESDLAGNEAKWTQELGQVWTVTMPAIVGIAGINPLTVHYCFRPPRPSEATVQGSGVVEDGSGGDAEGKLGDFWLVVLEVHNTFSERHVYILESGVGEDCPSGLADTVVGSAKRKGYDHQWTFARSFHVSPFNDRGGYYRLFLREPFPNGTTTEPFVLGIHLLLLVESDRPGAGAIGAAGSPFRLEKKLMASLDSYPETHERRVMPLTALHLYAALLRQPLDLFLTFARILFQAAKLHFFKKLDAFGRPDMVQEWEADEFAASQQQWDGTGPPPPLNPIQPHRVLAHGGADRKSAATTRPAGGLFYPAHAFAEETAKRQLERFAKKRIDQLQTEDAEYSWSLRVVNRDPADAALDIQPDATSLNGDGLGKGAKRKAELVLYTRSGSVYTDLVQFGDARLVRLVGSLVGHRWGVNDVELFERFFGMTPGAASRGKVVDGGGGASRCGAWIQKVRRWHLAWMLRRAIDVDRSIGGGVDEARETLQKLIGTPSLAEGGCALDGANPPWSVLATVLAGYVAAVGEERAFRLLGARYVEGTEPWLELQRGVALVRDGKMLVPSWDTKLGSVRRA
ncbi:hypothetical protein ACQY0O_005885 [Thecaphora frezii]